MKGNHKRDVGPVPSGGSARPSRLKCRTHTDLPTSPHVPNLAFHGVSMVDRVWCFGTTIARTTQVSSESWEVLDVWDGGRVQGTLIVQVISVEWRGEPRPLSCPSVFRPRHVVPHSYPCWTLGKHLCRSSVDRVSVRSSDRPPTRDRSRPDPPWSTYPIFPPVPLFST